ncbi:hypothetical protein KP509_27G008200 [Ceratopteris richardii]|uniref:TCP domain-containing protein n=1 Tax=Ceratopteris richardii TaxID=49495 RepID=A0A8T2RG46_CERRI|nr:hypothetical protein KP509_27G008200 [Ceratopteris richardii]
MESTPADLSFNPMAKVSPFTKGFNSADTAPPSSSATAVSMENSPGSPISMRCKPFLTPTEVHPFTQLSNSVPLPPPPRSLHRASRCTVKKKRPIPRSSKDRHSKVPTAKGLRDRRVRLSASCALQIFDIQERLGLAQPSKAIDWLLEKAKPAIDNLETESHKHSADESSTSTVHCTSAVYEQEDSVECFLPFTVFPISAHSSSRATSSLSLSLEARRPKESKVSEAERSHKGTSNRPISCDFSLLL